MDGSMVSVTELFQREPRSERPWSLRSLWKRYSAFAKQDRDEYLKQKEGKKKVQPAPEPETKRPEPNDLPGLPPTQIRQTLEPKRATPPPPMTMRESALVPLDQLFQED